MDGVEPEVWGVGSYAPRALTPATERQIGHSRQARDVTLASEGR